jgi:IMP dehydrogenase
MTDRKLAEVMSVVAHDDDFSRWHDPLTQLPRLPALREWSMEKLRNGHEISIIFFDIDLLGRINRKYGHVVGDQVLKQVAQTIKQELDSNTAILCHYGGDEFVAATLHTLNEAQQLAARIARKVEETRLPEVHERVSISYGVSFGRGSDERDYIHYVATVDDLVFRASQLCMQHGQRR